MRINKFAVLFFVLPFVLVLIWFRGDYFIAGGEEGIPIYNALRTLNIYRWPWGEIATGYPIPIFLPRVTYLACIYLLEVLFTTRVAQMILFWSLMVSGTVGVYLFTKTLTHKPGVSAIAGSFYLLNLYSQSQVWNRLLYVGMFAWAYLPLFLYLILKWYRDGKFKWLIVFLVSSIFFSNTFGHPAFIFTLWLPAFLLVFIEICNLRKNIKKTTRIVIRFLALVIFWIIVNLWWIYPYAKLGSISFSEITGSQANLESLQSVSQYFPTGQIALLKQSYIFGKGSVWFDFYSKPLIYIISIIVFGIAIIGFLKSRKEKFWPFIIVLLFLGWFICKGTNFPFGHIFYKLLFSVFPSTQALRNSYEKFGLVFLLPYSIFFALGINWIYRTFNPKIKNMVVGTLLILSCGVLVLPMWTGDIYKGVKVSVPSYYEGANTYLNDINKEGRVLALPLSSGDAAHYTWGYGGIEPGEFLFDRESVSKILRTKYFDEKYLSLYTAFVNNKEYNNLLEEMNIKYLVLRNDLISEKSNASSSAQVKKIIDQNKYISELNNFGELTIFAYKKDITQPLFITRGENAPEINYRKLSPQKYEINIVDANKPYDLIFKETYDSLWQAEINGRMITDHFLVYDYANAWKIGEQGNYTIDITYKIWPWD